MLRLALFSHFYLMLIFSTWRGHLSKDRWHPLSHTHATRYFLTALFHHFKRFNPILYSATAGGQVVPKSTLWNRSKILTFFEKVTRPEMDANKFDDTLQNPFFILGAVSLQKFYLFLLGRERQNFFAFMIINFLAGIKICVEFRVLLVFWTDCCEIILEHFANFEANRSPYT